MMFLSLLKRLRSEQFWKERSIAGIITLTYALGNIIEYFSGKIAEDPPILWITAIILGTSVIVTSASRYKAYTYYLFYTFLIWLTIHCAVNYSYGVVKNSNAQEFYLLISYVSIIVVSQVVDSSRALMLFCVFEFVIFSVAVFFVRDYHPILLHPLQLLMFVFVLVGSYALGYLRIMRTQVNPNSDIQFKAISENARDGQAIIDSNMKFAYMNAASSQITGFTNAELMSKRMPELIADEDLKFVKSTLVSIINGETDKVSVEYRIHAADNKLIWVESILSSFSTGVFNKNKFVFAETRDITQRKELEHEIKKQLQVEELLIKHSNQFINVERTEIQQGIDIALADFGKILQADGVLVYRMHGKLHDEFRSTNQWFDRGHQNLSHHFNLVVKINQQLILFLRTLRGDKSAHGNFILTHQLADVQVLNVPDVQQKLFYLIPLQSGNVVNGFVVFVFNETIKNIQSSFFGLIGNMVASAFTRLRTEMRLHEAQLTNEFILRALPDWLYIINKSGEFTGSNNYTSLPPYIPDYDLIGRTLSDVLPKDVSVLFSNALNEVIESDLSSSFEFHDTAIHKGRYFKVVVAPFKANEYLMIVRDITDLINTKTELETKALKLEQSNKELEEFAYIVSHDMKQPIRTIISYLTLLKRKHGPALPEEALEFLNFSIDGANKMSDLIRDILQYSKLEQQISFVTEVNLNDVMRTVVANLKETLTANKVELICPSLPVIRGNETMLTELFQNLIENGVKYNNAEQKKVTIELTDEGNNYQFVISDNGIGFEQEYAKQIFKIFKRLHSESEFPGTGIGLTICQKVVEKHYGKIRAESEKGKGSRFIFTLAKGL